MIHTRCTCRGRSEEARNEGEVAKSLRSICEEERYEEKSKRVCGASARRRCKRRWQLGLTRGEGTCLLKNLHCSRCASNDAEQVNDKLGTLAEAAGRRSTQRRRALPPSWGLSPSGCTTTFATTMATRSSIIKQY